MKRVGILFSCFIFAVLAGCAAPRTPYDMSIKPSGSSEPVAFGTVTKFLTEWYWSEGEYKPNKSGPSPESLITEKPLPRGTGRGGTVADAAALGSVGRSYGTGAGIAGLAIGGTMGGIMDEVKAPQSLPLVKYTVKTDDGRELVIRERKNGDPRFKLGQRVAVADISSARPHLFTEEEGKNITPEPARTSLF